MANPGYQTRVMVGEYDLSTYLTGSSANLSRENLDVTTFQPGTSDPVKSYLAGLRSGSVQLDGLFDPDSGASDAVIAAVMDGSSQTVTVSVEGANTIGDRAVVVNAIQTSAPIAATASSAVTLSTGREGTGSAKLGVILHPSTARTSAANFASVDHSASSLKGAAANLHVVSFTGTSAVVKVSDSADDSTFADLITFTTVTAATAERSTVAGTVNRYARIELTGTFTSILFVVSFARN